MVEKTSITFKILNVSFLCLLALITLLPMLHVLALSISDKAAVEGNLVGLRPVGVHLSNYRHIFSDERIIRAFGVSVLRVVVGVSIQMFFILTLGYPLARSSRELTGRNAIMWFVVFPMLFQGGLIPTYILIRQLGLIDTFWALVLGPIAVQIFSIILMMNFFKTIPDSLYESALIDGASHWKIMLRIFIPIAKPAVATLSLFAIVSHWNSWFDGQIYLNNQEKWPIQTLLRYFLVGQIDYANLDVEDLARMRNLSNRSLKAAQVFITTVPILAVYPFLQKHFVKGIVLGSVKE